MYDILSLHFFYLRIRAFFEFLMYRTATLIAIKTLIAPTTHWSWAFPHYPIRIFSRFGAPDCRASSCRRKLWPFKVMERDWALRTSFRLSLWWTGSKHFLCTYLTSSSLSRQPCSLLLASQPYNRVSCQPIQPTRPTYYLSPPPRMKNHKLLGLDVISHETNLSTLFSIKNRHNSLSPHHLTNYKLLWPCITKSNSALYRPVVVRIRYLLPLLGDALDAAVTFAPRPLLLISPSLPPNLSHCGKPFASKSSLWNF